MLKRKVFYHVISLFAVLLLGGFLSATLVRLAPGRDADEQLLDAHLSSASQQALRDSRRGEQNALQFYARSARNLLRGDLGVSRSLGQPVARLLRDRAPATARLIFLGLLIGWSAALAFALSATVLRLRSCEFLALAVSGALLSLPAAVLALLSVMWNLGGSLAVGLVVFPRVHRYARNLLETASTRPHITTARAKGLSVSRILFWHIIPVVGPQLLAIFGVSVSIALAAAIPIEALCGIAGVGQLAWQAAMARDLPLIVHLTGIVAFFTVTANSLADIVATATREPAS